MTLATQGVVWIRCGFWLILKICKSTYNQGHSLRAIALKHMIFFYPLYNYSSLEIKRQIKRSHLTKRNKGYYSSQGILQQLCLLHKEQGIRQQLCLLHKEQWILCLLHTLNYTSGLTLGVLWERNFTTKEISIFAFSTFDLICSTSPVASTYKVYLSFDTIS